MPRLGWKRARLKIRFRCPTGENYGRCSTLNALPKAEQQLLGWQNATEVLLLVVESKSGPTMLARIGIMRA